MGVGENFLPSKFLLLSSFAFFFPTRSSELFLSYQDSSKQKGTGKLWLLIIENITFKTSPSIFRTSTKQEIFTWLLVEPVI